MSGHRRASKANAGRSTQVDAWQLDTAFRVVVAHALLSGPDVTAKNVGLDARFRHALLDYRVARDGEKARLIPVTEEDQARSLAQIGKKRKADRRRSA